MHTIIQRHFRYYLAAFLSILLAVGVRLQAAPLGTEAVATGNAATGTAPATQVRSEAAALALR